MYTQVLGRRVNRNKVKIRVEEKQARSDTWLLGLMPAIHSPVRAAAGF